MSYRLKISKQQELEVHKTFDTQLKKILDLISDHKLNEEEKIHEIRKSFKKLRALLKLIQYDLKDRKVYSIQNEYYKNASKRFSSSRDNSVLRETYESLIKKYHIPLQLDKNLLQDSPILDHPQEFKLLEQELLQKRLTLHIYQLKNKKYPFKKGLEKIYQQLLINKKRAYKTYEDEAFHEWRKSVKNYMYQLHLFQDILDKKMKKKLNSLNKLSELLGKDHDLSMLKEFFFLRNPNDLIIDYTKKEQKHLRKKASSFKLKGLKRAIKLLKKSH